MVDIKKYFTDIHSFGFEFWSTIARSNNEYKILSYLILVIIKKISHFVPSITLKKHIMICDNIDKPESEVRSPWSRVQSSESKYLD